MAARIFSRWLSGTRWLATTAPMMSPPLPSRTGHEARKRSQPAVDWSSTPGAPLRAEATLARFLRAKLIGQRFRYARDEELPLVEAVQRLLLLWPMAIWTARALAADRGAVAVTADDLAEALRSLDISMDRVSTSVLKRKQREAWEFAVYETDLAVRAAAALLSDPVQ